MRFWSLEHLDLEDPLNAEIWDQSASEQEQIQPYRSDWQIGDVGAQQAMRSPYRLPWVPDPVGLDWHRHDALLVVGSAYGPFVAGDGRRHEILPSEYMADSCKGFGKVFFEKVIRNREFYTRVGELAESVVSSCRSLAIFELCRVAFVRRAERCDKGGDGVAVANPELFTRYVESPKQNDWLWRRVVGSEASTILALGTIAEHGLLRLFARNLCGSAISDSADRKIRFDRYRSEDARWLTRYANIRRKIGGRSERASPPFWLVQGRTADGKHRSWRVTVVPHPTGGRGSANWHSVRLNSIKALRVVYKG